MTHPNTAITPERIARAHRAQSLRNLAHTWYALALACRCMGAMIERAAKEVLHESTDDNTN